MPKSDPNPNPNPTNLTNDFTGVHDGDERADPGGHEEQGRRLQGEEQAHRRDPGADGAHRGTLGGEDVHAEGRGEARDPGMRSLMAENLHDLLTKVLLHSYIRTVKKEQDGTCYQP